MPGINKHQLQILIGSIVIFGIAVTIGTDVWSVLMSAGKGLVAFGGAVALPIAIFIGALITIGVLYLLFQWLRVNRAAKETVTENTANNTRTIIREYAARAEFKWGSFWSTILNLFYIVMLLGVIWLGGTFLWSLLTAGTPAAPYSSVTKEYIWWQPDLAVLLQLIVGALIFLWLAPKKSHWTTKLLLAFTGFIFYWYFVNAIAPHGIGTWVKKTAIEIDRCFKDDTCRFFKQAATPSAPVQQLKLPKRVLVPHCDHTWSELIEIPPRLRVTWEFADWPVKTLVGKGSVKREYKGEPNTDGSAVRFCTRSALHVGKHMDLIWKPY